MAQSVQRRVDGSGMGGVLRLLWHSLCGVLRSALLLAAMPLLAPQAAAVAQPLVQRQSLGAVHLTLSTDRQTMGFADRLRLTLGVEIPPEMAVVFPRLSGTLGPFSVRSQRLLEPQKTPAHTWHWQQEYILAAEHLGALTIPPLTVAVQAAGAAPTVTPQHLATEALVITVTPLLPEDADVTAPRDIGPPVALVRPGVSLWIWGAAGMLGGLGLLVGTWCYQRWWQSTDHAIPPQPAHVLALAALEQLWREDLISQQRLEEFYMRLSDILRDYVTWRFGLHAATRTTDELLAAALTTVGCLAAHHDLLSTCLRHCDLVKFARYRPAPDAIPQVWESARAFVEQTAEARLVLAPPETTPTS